MIVEQINPKLSLEAQITRLQRHDVKMERVLNAAKRWKEREEEKKEMDSVIVTMETPKLEDEVRDIFSFSQISRSFSSWRKSVSMFAKSTMT